MAKDSVVRNNVWKWLVLALIAGVAIYAVNPPLDVKDEKGKVIEQGRIRLGLDLQGGTSFTLGIDKEKLAETIVAANPQLTNNQEQVEAEVAKRLDGCDARVIQVIRRRVDAMGMNEPVIQGLKDHRVLVQLPGASNEVSLAAERALRSAAFLEFRLTHPRNTELVGKLLGKDVAPEGYVKGGQGYVRAADYAEISRKPGYAARLATFQVPNPQSYCFMLEKESDNSYRPAFVSRKVELTGESLVAARVDSHPVTGALSIDFELDADGGKKFSDVTRAYKPHGTKNPRPEGRQLAIILDGMLISAPSINSEIGRNGQITGSFTAAEAQQLANDLNAGALPAPMTILAQSSVSPTVGEDAIASAKWAAGIGFCLVAIFMFFYYWRSGLVADVALFLDIALLPTALILVANVLGVFAHDPSMGGGGSMQLPVLTMPGIAGLVLTLGMAVDANVLIFERIREEFQAGRAAGQAIKNGYGRAFTAIFDSNLTTIITGIILFVVGTGPVRGFAIMLTAGVVISMFTAVVVTRLVFDHCVDPNRVKPFKMMQVFKNPKYDFMKVTKFTVGGSFAVIALTIALFAVRLTMNKASVLAVDLTGGTSIEYVFNRDAMPSTADVRKALDAFDNAAVIQYQNGGASLLVKTGETAETEKGRQLKEKNISVVTHVTELLQKAFPKAGFTKKSDDVVGSLVGADLKSSGTKAVLFSLVAILVYVAFRFKFGFGLGGLVALAHDALITLGIFSLCGRQVSLIVITALLTIIGYSINDTVVVFDRIRELMHRETRLNFRDVCNLAINQCLSRTVITSLTTFFAVLALFAFGDGSIFDFALTMLIGVVAGTYSSIFIATPVMFWWYKGKRPDLENEEKANG